MLASDAWKFKLERTGKRIVRELGDSSDLRCFAYQNCKRLAKEFWQSYPSNESSTLCRKFRLSSDTVRYVICDASHEWKRLQDELDKSVMAMSAKFLCNELGFKQRCTSPTLPVTWLDFLVEYGLVTSQIFQLTKYQANATLAGSLSQYGVKSVSSGDDFDNVWRTEVFDVVSTSIDVVEELINKPLAQDVLDDEGYETLSMHRSRSYTTSEIVASGNTMQRDGKSKVDPWHAEDFSTLIVDGVSYSVGTKWQRNAFEFLWDAALDGSPNVDFEELRENMDTESPPRRWDLAFQKDPELKKLIVKPKKNGRTIRRMLCLSFSEKISRQNAK